MDGIPDLPRHHQLKDQAYAYIRGRILDLTFPPGSPLREAALERELGISKTPIREALVRLEQDGYLTVIPYRGAFVTGYTSTDLKEIYELRELIEGVAARNAARTIEPEVLNRLHEVGERSREALAAGDVDAVAQLFDEFDELLCAEVVNSRIGRLIEDLRGHLVRIGRMTVAIPGRLERSIEQHEAILHAIEQRDEDAAESLMRLHVRSVLEDQLGSPISSVSEEEPLEPSGR